jgi:hydroxymethylglutaryl-CoA reductase
MNQDIKFLKEELWPKLAELKPDTPAKWGKMGPQHMVEHLGSTTIISYGRFDAPAMYEEEKLKRNYEYIIQGRRRLKQSTNAPVLPEEPLPLRFDSLETAIDKLKKLMDDFLAHFEEHPEAKYMHPAFGLLNFEEWAYFHAMHAQYHLDQFALYEGGALKRD